MPLVVCRPPRRDAPYERERDETCNLPEHGVMLSMRERSPCKASFHFIEGRKGGKGGGREPARELAQILFLLFFLLCFRAAPALIPRCSATAAPSTPAAPGATQQGWGFAGVSPSMVPS